MADEQVLHAVMLPWSAFGHMMPFFQLSIGLAKSGFKVSFVSTPKNIQRLPKPPPDLAALINFVELQLPVLDNQLLPEGAEATVDIPFDKIQYLKVAYDLLRDPFEQFVASQSPDWIIIDMISTWVGKIAQRHRVPVMHFSVFSAATYAFFGPEILVGYGREKLRSSPESLTSVPEWVDFPSSLAFRSFEAKDVYAGFYGSNASGMIDVERVAYTLHGCQAVAVRSCPEYEGEYLNLLQKIIGKPVIPVGLLAPENNRETDKITDESWIGIFRWLDEQKPRSVVFVGFGSECKLTKDQVYEIAYGLELSGLPFLWALRKPDWVSSDAVDAPLPSGFGERTRGRGVVSIGWAPQLQILEHQSIGGSLFHSGWGSVIETLQFGHCLVVLPLIVDQPMNARILVEKGLAVEVDRREDGSFSRDDIARALRLAMVSEDGVKLRVGAREAAVIFNDRNLHQRYFDSFIDYLRVNILKKEMQQNHPCCE